jgi:D-alanyl-D-alanine carboxypeptidase/D-alanyl-D-alanine-endopeptidase (penicillin-binding protein 4)
MFVLLVLGLVASGPSESISPSPGLPTGAAGLLAGLPSGDLSTRLDRASAALLGRGYLLGPLGEGDSAWGDPEPRFRLDSFDCVTYVETSLALALSPEPSRLLSTLDSIRYRDGRVRWAERNHFFEADWLPRNSRLLRPVPFPEDTLLRRRVSRRSFYAKRGVEVADTVVDLPVLWRDRAIERFARASDSARIRGVALVGKVEGYPVLHTGFLVERPGRPALLRHASQAGTVREQPFAAYLREKTKFVGVLVWEPIGPPGAPH